MKTGKEILEGIDLYGIKLSAFLLPDQLEILALAIENNMIAYGIECLKKAADSATLQVRNYSKDLEGIEGEVICDQGNTDLHISVNKESIRDITNLR